VNIKKKDVDRHIKTWATDEFARIRLSKTHRLSLIHFGARQTAKGVTYQIKKGGGRTFIKSAFIAKLKGVRSDGSDNLHVTKREGRKRLPIQKLEGISPWGVYTKAGLGPEMQVDATALLEKNLRDRVRYLLLKAEGRL